MSPARRRQLQPAYPSSCNSFKVLMHALLAITDALTFLPHWFLFVGSEPHFGGVWQRANQYEQ